jgi:hypothetical protein
MIPSSARSVRGMFARSNGAVQDIYCVGDVVVVVCARQLTTGGKQYS